MNIFPKEGLFFGFGLQAARFEPGRPGCDAQMLLLCYGVTLGSIEWRLTKNKNQKAAEGLNKIGFLFQNMYFSTHNRSKFLLKSEINAPIVPDFFYTKECLLSSSKNREYWPKNAN